MRSWPPIAIPALVRWLSLVVTLVEIGLVASLFFLDLQPHAGPQGTWLLVEDYPWIPWLGARYSLGLDGISLLLLLLVAFINIFCVLCSWKAIDFKEGSFYFFILFLEGTLAGLFLAADLLLFYLFWEIQIIPMFFLVGIWGHENRIHAAIKFLLYTLAGSLVMLIALMALYVLHGHADRGLHLLGVPVDAARPLGPHHRNPAVRRLSAGLRHQGAPHPGAHLAARHPHRGPHRRQRGPGRAALEDRGLRHLPICHPALSPRPPSS